MLVSLFFFAHQPDRLRPYDQRRYSGPIPPESLYRHYFDDELNRSVFLKVAERCYYPATRLILELVERFKSSERPFRVAYGLSGTFLDQAERYSPDLLDILRQLVATGCVELTGETYYHSVASLFGGDRVEFREQARMHADRLHTLFGVRASVFRNTECLYDDGIAAAAKHLGWRGIITEGVDWLAERGNPPGFLYESPGKLPVLLRNYRLSDDIGFRFSNQGWQGWPLTVGKFAGRLAESTDPYALIALDYEALGEHIPAETGIFDFLCGLPEAVAKHPNVEFITPTEAVRRLQPEGIVSVPEESTISWADMERDSSAWIGNEMQRLGFEELKLLEELVKATGDSHILDCWRRLLTSDHLYYAATKGHSDAEVHRYFSAYGSPFEAFVRLFTAIEDMRLRAYR